MEQIKLICSENWDNWGVKMNKFYVILFYDEYNNNIFSIQIKNLKDKMKIF